MLISKLSISFADGRLVQTYENTLEPPLNALWKTPPTDLVNEILPLPAEVEQ